VALPVPVFRPLPLPSPPFSLFFLSPAYSFPWPFLFSACKRTVVARLRRRTLSSSPFSSFSLFSPFVFFSLKVFSDRARCCPCLGESYSFFSHSPFSVPPPTFPLKVLRLDRGQQIFRKHPAPPRYAQGSSRDFSLFQAVSLDSGYFPFLSLGVLFFKIGRKPVARASRLSNESSSLLSTLPPFSRLVSFFGAFPIMTRQQGTIGPFLKRAFFKPLSCSLCVSSHFSPDQKTFSFLVLER